MPRKGSVSKRKVPVDPKFGDLTVAKFINSLMQDGKKSKAEMIFYGSLKLIGEKTGKDPVEELKPIVQYVTGFCAKDCAEPKGDVMIQFGTGKVNF
ncbi:MAG: hypothetical protein F9K51_00175, partial [Candidatus Dadabacteria bacterium]